jgi:hypothetical protein
MGNLQVQPAVPAANGTGAGSSVAAMGLEKTIYVDGTFTGAVTVEAMTGQGFVPVATFTAPGRKLVKMAAEEMRVVRTATTAIPGTPAVSISGNDDGAQFADIPLGSPGASVDISSHGVITTIIVDGVIDGVVQIQTSEDDVTYTDLCAFQTPGHKTVEITSQFVRSNHVNNVLGSTPTVSLGSINDDTAQQPENVIAPAANVSIDSALGQSASLLLDGISVTVDNITNCEVGDHIELVVRQNAGAETLSWGAAFQWPGGTAPVISAGAGAVDKIELYVAAVDASGVATQVLGTVAQNFS